MQSKVESIINLKTKGGINDIGKEIQPAEAQSECRQHKRHFHKEGRRQGVETAQKTEHAAGIVLLRDSEQESDAGRSSKNEKKIWEQDKVMRR